MTTNRLLTSAQAAELIGVTTRTLQTWRKEGTGPNYVRLGTRTIKYPASEINAWIANRTIKAGAENYRAGE